MPYALETDPPTPTQRRAEIIQFTEDNNTKIIITDIKERHVAGPMRLMTARDVGSTWSTAYVI